MVRDSIDPEETRALATNLDPDTTDFWDETGVPPPHRLSSHFSHSPYPNSHENLPLAPPRPSTSAYTDPYLVESPPHSIDMQRPNAFGANRYDSSDSLKAKAYAGVHDQDAWGIPESNSFNNGSQTAARERWLARKEAAAIDAAISAPFTYGKPAKSKKWWWLGGVGLLVAAAVAAVVVLMIRKNGSKSETKAVGAVESDPNDPSVFTKDPNLHNSFYGICYTPMNAQYPACGDSQAGVTEDIQLISQLTNKIRLYGADCNVSQLVLQAIQETKTDLSVYLALWVDDNAETYARQVKEVTDAIKAYGVDRIDGITVGNEYLLNGGSAADLVQKMADMRTTLAGMNLPKTIPVGTADAGSMITTQLSEGADYIFANIHGFFGKVPVEEAAGWTWDYANNHEPSTALTASNKPQLFIAESGWPSGANETRFLADGGAVAGIDQLNTFLDTFVCQSNANYTAGTGQASFIFEAFDEPWKDALYGGVEAHWGIFTSDKKLKEGLKIPDCAHA
ncbi:glycoside hydrolase [Violaceomyces palustris]|uniref:Glycoside hydrolase n=1 Tax=Violaceomyces palustris TaxID=1673888 RepID=A0ACD0NPN7_9BASI|nr:glycoside hydrolase [Violaceomyces palustris]